MKALVVDDSRAMQSILKRILSSVGFEVYQASGGDQALAALSHEAAGVQLICADHNMPGINGIELVRRIRERPRTAGIKILMVTTETHIGVFESALHAGVDEYLMKPFTPEMLVEKLHLLGIDAGVTL